MMAANALVQTRIDEGIKKEASIVLEAIGLTVSDAVRLMLTRVAQEKALPFEPLIPNKETIAALKEAREGKLETVTLKELQLAIDTHKIDTHKIDTRKIDTRNYDADDSADRNLQARPEARIQRAAPGFPFAKIS